MPLVKPQELKSIAYQNLQPDKMSSRIQIIIAMDIAGYSGGSIAKETGLTENRVSIIRNSPLFIEARDAQRSKLTSQIIEKQSDKIVAGDPVEQKLKSLALSAVNKQEALMNNANSEFVQKACSDSILDRAGYKARTDKNIVSVEITEKMADRFERVLSRVTTITKES
jgi:hypothetical protein